MGNPEEVSLSFQSKAASSPSQCPPPPPPPYTPYGGPQPYNTNQVPQQIPNNQMFQYPPNNQAPQYLPNNQAPQYPPNNQLSQYPANNQGFQSHPNSQAPHYPPNSQIPQYPPNNQFPQYPPTNLPPPGAAAVASSSSATPTPIKFPPTFNGYYQMKFTSTFHLGPSAEQKLYAVRPGGSLLRHALTLYDGPTQSHPVLAKVESTSSCSSRAYVVTAPPPPSSSSSSNNNNDNDNNGPEDDAAGFTERLEGTSSWSAHRTASFSIEVGGPGAGEKGSGTWWRRRERFEWRRSRGSEIGELAGSRLSYGWKLVRVDAPAWDGGSGSGGQATSRFASDGKEVVAVVAHNTSFSMTKGLKFAFLGSGLTGELGERWEIMTVATAVQLWYRDVKEASQSAG